MTLASMKRKYEARVVPKGSDGSPLTTSAMIASLSAEGYETADAPFGHALLDYARRDERVVGMTADLSKYTDSKAWCPRWRG